MPVVEKGAVGCPLSLHASSGLAYVRVTEQALDESLKSYENYKKFCNPEFAVAFAQKNEKLYSQVVHTNKTESFERLTKDLQREMVLFLHTARKDTNLSPDHSLFHFDSSAEEILSKYF